MKQSLLFVLALSMAPIFAFAGSQTVKVDGMTCGSCESKVKKALIKLPNIEKVTADASSGEVILTVAEGKKAPSLDEIAKATEGVGFKVLR